VRILLIQPSYSKEKTKEGPREGKELRSGKRNMKEKERGIQSRAQMRREEGEEKED